VHLQDAREVTRDTFGPFDAVASLGAFEHFCSPEDYAAGRQEDIYRGLFAHVAGLLPERGRFYLQTMVFGRNMIPVEQIDRHAPRDSDAWYLAMMGAAFPGSWLPFGSEQVERCAEPHFRLASKVSGRLDYIETIKELGQAHRGVDAPARAAQAPAHPQVAHQRGLPLRVHVGRRLLEPRLFRARAHGPLPVHVREGRRLTPVRRRLRPRTDSSAENRPWREKSEAAQG